MDVLLSHQVPEIGRFLAHRLGQDERVARADFVHGEDRVLDAVVSHQYDVHLIGHTSLPVCRSVTRRVIEQDIIIHVPHRRVLFGDSPSALSVAHAIWLGFDGVVDLAGTSAVVDNLLGDTVSPIEFARLSGTGAPLVAICHDRTDIHVLAGIVEGLSDPEIAETLHYAVQSIRNRVSRLLTESGARNRTHLAALFMREGGVATG